MISVDVARTGVPVLKQDGRFLASSVDPEREAKSWADRALQNLPANERLIILGIGSGYHICELLERKSEFVVIEAAADLVAAVKAHFLATARAEIIVDQDCARLIENEAFCEVVCGVYRVAPYGPSVQMNRDFFEGVERLLRARDPLAFLTMLKARPELIAQLDPAALKCLSAEAVTIKTLARLFAPSAQASRERRLWRVLEELVQ